MYHISHSRRITPSAVGFVSQQSHQGITSHIFVYIHNLNSSVSMIRGLLIVFVAAVANAQIRELYLSSLLSKNIM